VFNIFIPCATLVICLYKNKYLFLEIFAT